MVLDTLAPSPRRDRTHGRERVWALADWLIREGRFLPGNNELEPRLWRGGESRHGGVERLDGGQAGQRQIGAADRIRRRSA